MIKNILLIVIISVTVINSQEQNPNVELPDFVILGKDVISVRNVDKMNPDYISTVSDEFLKPKYKPDYLALKDISNPIETEITTLDSANFRKGFIELKAGRYQLPAGELNYTFPYTGGMIHGFIKGLNQTSYVDNSDKQFLEGSLDFSYALPTGSEVLPGTKFSLSGEHSKNVFKFFGSIDPERKRNLNIGNATLGIQNLYLKEFIFDINGGGDFTYIDGENFNESIVFINAFGRLNLNKFSLGIKANHQHQRLTTDFYESFKTNAYFLRPTASLEIFNKVMLEAGFTFSGTGDENLNGLFASAGAQLAKNLVLLAEYSPEAENISAGKLLRKNFYYDEQELVRIFVKKKNKLKGTLKYEFDKYYQIDGGIEYFSSNNLPYFTNSDSSGFFSVTTAEAINLEIFLNMLYHLGPYGYFYGSAAYNNITDSDSKKIPYYPGIRASLIYGYHFSEQWRGEVKLNFLSDRYADIENTEERKLQSISYLDVAVFYNIESNFGVFFEINNLFNTKRALWEGYQEKPIDVMVGLNYFFD